jgi:hypothetical protein
MGPIVCRVITCSPPWVWETTCTTTSATDNNTAFHNRPCLQASDPTDPVVPPPPPGATSAQKSIILFSEDDTMKLIQRPGSVNTWYLMYPNGLMINVTSNSNSIQQGGVERFGGIKPEVFNRMVDVNERVRGLLGLNRYIIGRV